MVYTWRFIKQHANEEKQLCGILFERKPRVQQAYNTFKQQVLQEYRDYSDYIKVEHLHWNKRTDTKTTQLTAIKHPSARDQVVTLNKYPYNLSPNVKHYVFWRTRPLSPMAIVKTLDKLFHNKEYVYQVNSTHNQSVKHLWHVHVFFRQQ